MRVNLKVLLIFIFFYFADISISKSQCLTCTTNNPLNSGLIWCHPFSGNANDITGNGYDGFVSGATLIPDRAGNLNSAYNFNGTSSYISISKLLPSFLPTFSLSMWLKPGTNTGNSFVLWEGDNACGNDIYLVVQNSTIKFGANKNSSLGGLGNSLHTYTVPGSFINTWTHIVWVMEPTNSKLFVNGILVHTMISPGNGSGYNFPASYGSKYDGIGGACGVARQFYYQGAIDDVRLYNRSLNASEANILFNLIPGTIPTITSISDKNICRGDSLQVNPIVSNATSYLWSPAIGVSNVNVLNPYFKPSNSTSYILTAINNLCSAKDTFIINVNLLNLELGPDKNLCLGDSLQVNPTISNANNFTWSPSIDISNINIANPYIKPTISKKYFLNVSNGTCSLKDSITISVNTITLDVGIDKTICLGDSVEINPLAGSGTFEWSPSIGLSSTNTKNTIAKPFTSTKYYLNHINGACSLKDSISIFVNTISAELGNDTSFCFGDSIQLNPTTSSSTTYTWSPVTGISNPIIKNPFFKPINPTKYFLTVSNGVCSAKDSININPITISADAGMNLVICLGDSVKLNAIAGTGQYAWYPKTGITDTSISNPFIKPTIDTKYYLKYTENGCDITDSLIANVRQISLNAGPDKTICLGDSVKIQATQTGAINLNWTPGIGLSDTNILQPWAKPNSTQKYIIQIDDGICFKADSLTINIFDNELISKSRDTSICSGNSIQLNIFGGTAWEWINPYKLSSNNIPNPIASPLVDTNYVVKISNNSCFLYDTISLKVNQKPSIYAGNDTFHCFDKSIQIFGNRLNSSLTYWQNNPYFSDTFNLNQIVSVNNKFKFILVGELNGCFNYDTILVEEKPLVKADFTINVDKGFIPLNITLNNISPVTQYFTWSFNNNNTRNGQNLDTSFIYNQREDLNILLTVTDSFGCKDTMSKSVKILLEPIFKIPNVFTPNADSSNDYFEILHNPEAFKYVEYEVYNRWGQLLYETKMPGGKWWDGTFDGNPCPEGVYFYIAIGEALNGKIFNAHGTLTLLR